MQLFSYCFFLVSCIVANFDLQRGRFTGNTGCNSMSGNFVKKEDGLLFNEDIITTKKACEDYNEKTF